jgi:hypothetical protein
MTITNNDTQPKQQRPRETYSVAIGKCRWCGIDTNILINGRLDCNVHNDKEKQEIRVSRALASPKW